MKGWLVVNGFLQSNKFDELYVFLRRAAASLGIELEEKTSTELFDCVDGQLQDKPDFVLFWDKDYALAKRLENAGLRCFNSAEGIRLADDKTLTALALSGKVRTPKTMIAPMTFDTVGYADLFFLARAKMELGFPMIVKEAHGSFGRQVYLVKSEEELEKLVAGFAHKPFLLQEYIACSSGRDLRVNVVGGKVLCGILRENDGDFRSNITGGGRARALPPTGAQADAAVAACRALGLDFAGVDILFGKWGEPLVCEVNSNPHFKSSYDCTGVDMSVEILRYIQETLA